MAEVPHDQWQKGVTLKRKVGLFDGIIYSVTIDSACMCIVSPEVCVGIVPELATGGMPEVASSDVGIVTGELQHE